ncbi:MAG: hypothetical protein ACI30R_10185 [Sodaliphilus sp.]
MKRLLIIWVLMASVACAASAQTPGGAAPVQAQTVAEPEAGSNMLVMGAFTLCGCLGIVLALVALAKIKKLKKEKDNEITALKTAMKQRNDDTEQQLQALSARLAQAEECLSRRAIAQPEAPTSQQKPMVEVQKAKAQPVVTFVSRPNDSGHFTSANSRMEPGNSIFKITSADGVNATFEVINDAGVHQLALMMPTDTLTRACTGENIQISAGKTRIVTDAPGTAKKEGNRWKIVKPAVIHYE